MVLRPDGHLRLPSVMERERLMGFPLGYISCGLSSKLSMEERFNLGACMIGNSFNVFAITFLLDELLRTVDSSHRPRCLDSILARDEVAPDGWCSKPQFLPSSQPDAASGMLVQEFLRQGDKGGSDVKLDVGVPYRTKAWPRAGIRSSLFHWHVIHGYPWKYTAHINVLELQAAVNSMQWRLRKVSGFSQRLLHLVDSQVIAAVVAKGRSSSRRLRKGLQRLSALSLSGGLYISVGYVATHDNPADLPSRWQNMPKRRYKQAATRVLRFWRDSGNYPSSWDDFDIATGQWLEHIFAEGYPKGYASDGLAALQHFLPEVAGKLRHSWRLLKSWQKMEPPVRVLPISPLMVVAISGACLKLGRPSAAAAFLVCFDAFLRPGELYHLHKSDITWAGGRAVLSLGQTKSGQRKNASEMVVCHSQVTNYWLLQALKDKPRDAPLLDCSPSAFRHLFFTIIDHLGISGYFSLYSFRRGGATWDFVVDQNIEQTLLRGRWASTSTARIYLQDAAATLAHLSITDQQRSYMKYLSLELSAQSQDGRRGRR
eukprot:s256_g23.t1